MWIMGAHKMFQVGSTVSGTVDGASYDPQNLCDNDPHNPIRTPGGSFSFTIARTPGLAGINGLVVTNHNLDAGLTVTFSGLGTLETLAVPQNDVRRSAYALLATPVAGTITSTTVSGSGNSQAVVIGEVIIGIFEQLYAIAPEPGLHRRGFGTPNPGEFGGMAYERGADAIDTLTVTASVTAAELAILDACWEASRGGSRPTVVLPYDDASPEAWVVTWEDYQVSPVHRGYFKVAITWREISKFDWTTVEVAS